MLSAIGVMKREMHSAERKRDKQINGFGYITNRLKFDEAEDEVLFYKEGIRDLETLRAE